MTHVTENLFRTDFNHQHKTSSTSTQDNTWNGVFGYQANPLDQLLGQFNDLIEQAKCLNCRDSPNSIVTLSIVQISYSEQRYQSSIQTMEQKAAKSFEDIVADLVNNFQNMIELGHLTHRKLG